MPFKHNKTITKQFFVCKQQSPLQIRAHAKAAKENKLQKRGTMKESINISLDPIYDKLYQKILLQEELISDILTEAKKQGWDDGSFSDRFLRAEAGPLQIAVACEDIEKGLRELISDIESRYAALISELLAADSKRLQIIEKVAYTFGTRHAIPRNSSPSEAYQLFEGIFLDGMPEDQARCLLTENDSVCSWQLLKDLHSSYWTSLSSDGKTYYVLRKKILEGMFFDTMLSVGQTEENTFEIRKEG